MRLYDSEILERLLSYDRDLAEAYDIGHRFLSLQSKYNYDEFKEFMKMTISIYCSSSIPEFREVGETYTNWYTEICNSKIAKIGKRNLTNGPIEGRNNKIKLLKRVSFGMTNFEHLKKRIFLIFEDKETPIE